MRNLKIAIFVAALAGFAAFAATPPAVAQDNQERPTLNKDQQQTQQPASATTINLDAPAAPPVLSEEDTALKALQSMPEGSPENLAAKLNAAEAFTQKYPQSRYRSTVYTFLTVGYMEVGKAEKGIEYGNKELEINPDDVATMAILSQTLPRVYNPNAPDAAKRLERAETLGRRAVELMPTVPKPDGLTEEEFASSKNRTLAVAHSGLGVVSWRRGKFDDAIAELEQSVKLDPAADPVNWLILGVANQNTAHYDAAAAAFAHCATMPGKLQDACKARTEEARKLASTKLSAPK